MVDVARKVRRQGSFLLEPGERVLAATVVNPVGYFDGDAAVTGAAEILRAIRRGESHGDPDTQPTLADSFPVVRNSILVLTDRRWLSLGLGPLSGRIRRITGEWPHRDIPALEYHDGTLVNEVTVVFADGSRKSFAAVNGAHPDRLIAAAVDLYQGDDPDG